MNETCICPTYDCCTLCGTFSCDCSPETHRKMEEQRKKCKAHKPTGLENYNQSVKVELNGKEFGPGVSQALLEIMMPYHTLHIR